MTPDELTNSTTSGGLVRHHRPHPRVPRLPLADRRHGGLAARACLDGDGDHLPPPLPDGPTRTEQRNATRQHGVRVLRNATSVRQPRRDPLRREDRDRFRARPGVPVCAMRRSAVSPVQRGVIGGIETPRGLLGQLPHCLRTGQADDPIKAFPHAAPTPGDAVGQTAADNLATSEVSSDRWPFGSTRRWAVAVAGYIALQGAEDGVPHAHNSVSPPVGFSRSSPPRGSSPGSAANGSASARRPDRRRPHPGGRPR
jgi:hypothetical protein